MTSIVIKQRSFTAAKNVYSADVTQGLAAALRGLAIDNARNRIKALAPTHFTNNSGGTPTSAPYSLVDVPLPTTPFNATTSGGETLVDLEAGIAALNSAHAVLGNGFNTVASQLGLGPIVNITSTTGDEFSSAYVNFTEMPNPGDTITIGGSVLTFETAPVAPAVLAANQAAIQPSLVDTISSMAAAINGLTSSLNVTAETEGNQLIVVAAAAGTAGNSITLASSNTSNPVSSGTLVNGATEGTVAYTIAAVKTAGATGSGTAAADFTTSLAALTVLKSNHRKLARLFVQLLTALNEPPVATLLKGAYTEDFEMYSPIAPIGTVAGSTSSLALTDIDAFYVATANNVATMATAWNAALTDVAAGTAPQSVVAG